MAVATVLSGFSGVVVAAAAGCSGFAGSLGGREVVPRLEARWSFLKSGT